MSGIYDFPARKYPVNQGRWIAPDAAGLAAANPANPQSWNRYAYVASESGTDIFGALWHVKAVFESGQEHRSSGQPSRNIWIFSDMMNETKEFPVPPLLELGANRILERAKGNNLVVPLTGYKIHIIGASPIGLTPQQWMTLRRFWEIYFAAAGAELVSYSSDCNAQRN